MKLDAYRDLMEVYADACSVYYNLDAVRLQCGDEFESKLIYKQLDIAKKMHEDIRSILELHTGYMFNVDEYTYGKDKWNEIWDEIGLNGTYDDWIYEWENLYEND